MLHQLSTIYVCTSTFAAMDDIEDNRHRHTRSTSSDSEEERQRRRRRRERESRDGGNYRRARDNREESGRRERNDGRERHRSHRRSRSPRDERRSEYDRGTKSRDRDERSPRQGNERDVGSPKQAWKRGAGPLPSQEVSFMGDKGEVATREDGATVEKQKPSLAATGLLAAASNTVTQVDGTSVTLKYHEPPEARKPPAKDAWKLFVFKGADIIETIDLSLRSCWLVGRELSVVDMAAEHPSISKQHAVIQFRYIEKRNEYGDKLGKVKPYVIDLESANGTKLNKELVEASRYIELRDKDLIQFGDSTREYVLMLPPR